MNPRWQFYEDAPPSPAEDPSPPEDGASLLVCEIPAGLDSKRALFEQLARRLGFPEHFGHNWDALADCLTDRSWISGPVRLLHADLPLAAQPAEAATYLEILAEASEDAEGPRALQVCFPASAREQVQQLRSS